MRLGRKDSTEENKNWPEHRAQGSCDEPAQFWHRFNRDVERAGIIATGSAEMFHTCVKWLGFCVSQGRAVLRVSPMESMTKRVTHLLFAAGLVAGVAGFAQKPVPTLPPTDPTAQTPQDKKAQTTQNAPTAAT